MFRYRLHSSDGDDLGESTYAVMIKPGDEILVGNGRRLRVVDLVPSRPATIRSTQPSFSWQLWLRNWP
jgi:hypothetical protein